MFPKLPLLVLCLITASPFVFCQSNSSWNDLMDEFSGCVKSCFNDFYDDLVADTCGDVKSSTNLRDISCICNYDGPEDEYKYGQEVVGPCIADGCSEEDINELATETLDPLTDLLNWCKPAIEEYGITSTPNEDSGPSLRSQSIFAFTVVLFVAAYNL